MPVDTGKSHCVDDEVSSGVVLRASATKLFGGGELGGVSCLSSSERGAGCGGSSSVDAIRDLASPPVELVDGIYKNKQIRMGNAYIYHFFVNQYSILLTYTM